MFFGGPIFNHIKNGLDGVRYDVGHTCASRSLVTTWLLSMLDDELKSHVWFGPSLPFPLDWVFRPLFA